MQNLLKQSILLTAAITLDSAVAFVPSHFGLSPGSLIPSHRTQRLYSSQEDDELSRLIGKRNEIKRKRKEELPSEDDFLENMVTADPDSLDLEKMPDFQTQRKAIMPKKSEKKEKAKTETSNEVIFTDYYADYVSKTP